MSNKKEQTTVEWYTHRLYEIEIAYNQSVIDTEVYAKSKIHALEQAKEMEKQQRISDYYQGACDESDSHGAQYICESDAEQWYEKTYGGNK